MWINHNSDNHSCPLWEREVLKIGSSVFIVLFYGQSRWVVLVRTRWRSLHYALGTQPLQQAPQAGWAWLCFFREATRVYPRPLSVKIKLAPKRKKASTVVDNREGNPKSERSGHSHEYQRLMTSPQTQELSTFVDSNKTKSQQMLTVDNQQMLTVMKEPAIVGGDERETK